MKCCTGEYEVTAKGDKLEHSVKVDGSCNGMNGFVKVGGDPTDPTVHGSFFFDVPMVNGLKAVMDAKSKISGGCSNITGLHWSGCKDLCVAATIKNATANAELALDVHKKMDKMEAGCQAVYHLKTADTNVVAAVGYHVDSQHVVHFKVNKHGHLAFQLKKAFSPGFNLEFGALASAADFANPAGLKDSIKMGLKLNLKF